MPHDDAYMRDASRFIIPVNYLSQSALKLNFALQLYYIDLHVDLATAVGSYM